MKLLVGLGNPGPQYVLNRHNVGFQWIDALHQSTSVFSPFKAKSSLMLSEGTCEIHRQSEKLLLLKPLSFMNRSGIPTAEVLSFYKISLQDVYVFHDDLDLPFGKIKIKRGGGSGGHNGLKSLDAHIGQDYWRVRIGIDRPPLKEMVTPYVLGNFLKEELSFMSELFERMTTHLDDLLAPQHDRFLKAVNDGA